MRSLSHGCVRTQNVVDLAKTLFADDANPKWTPEKIDEVLASKKNVQATSPSRSRSISSISAQPRRRTDGSSIMMMFTAATPRRWRRCSTTSRRREKVAAKVVRSKLLGAAVTGVNPVTSVSCFARRPRLRISRLSRRRFASVALLSVLRQFIRVDHAAAGELFHHRPLVGAAKAKQPRLRPSLPCCASVSGSAYQALWITMARASALLFDQSRPLVFIESPYLPL